jgi:hypothetical protein
MYRHSVHFPKYYIFAVQGMRRMKRKQSISKLLLLCFSVILGHSLIPHHHHSEILLASADHPCPFGHDQQHEAGEHPFHCHAFNELAFFKEDPSDSSIRIPLVIQPGLLPESTGRAHPFLFAEKMGSSPAIPSYPQPIQGAVSSRAPPQVG